MKKISKILISLLFIIILITKKDIITSGIKEGLYLFINYLFPSIFPVYILSDYINSTGLINIITKYIGPLFNKIFKTSPYAAFVVLMSMITGSPSNAKYLQDLYQKDLINKDDTIKILSMDNFYNPLLILSLTSYLKRKDQLLLIISIILTNLLTGLINRNKFITNNTIKEFNIKFNLYISLNNTIKSLTNILGIICFYSIITKFMNTLNPVLSGFVEITNGLNNIKLSQINYNYKFLFTGIILSCSGLSIISQTKSILKDANLDYTLLYKSKIISLIIMIIICIVSIYLNL